jgi:hypothetical protein
MRDYSCQVQRSTLAERGDGHYETPPCAVRALLKVETLPFRIWEPACGRGSIARELIAAGHDVLATDLVDYGYGISRRDFLFERQCDADAIVTNAPFKLGHEFVRHALSLCDRVYNLARFAFYESERRCDILDNAGLRRVYVFRNRLPMMHRDGWVGRKSNSGMAFAWFCWDRSYRGATELHRISWQP